MRWWYTQDEERWNGPCETRAEAVAEGRGEYDDEGFMVCEAEQGELNLKISPYCIADWLDDENCDLTDPNGDDTFGAVSKEIMDDLGEMVETTIKAWATKHKLDTTAFIFTKQGDIEKIPALNPEPAE